MAIEMEFARQIAKSVEVWQEKCILAIDISKGCHQKKITVRS